MKTRLTENALLVKQSISNWGGHKYDRKVSKEVNDAHNATDEAGRYNKRLVTKEALKDVRKLAGQARLLHYEMTLPWEDGGHRLLPADLYFDYIKEQKKIKDEFMKAAGEFTSNYTGYIQDAKKYLGDLFSESDYPPADSIEYKFAFETSFMPFPVKEDFRVALGENEVERIQSDMEDHINGLLASATLDVWERAYKVVENMYSRLQDTDALFRNSLVSNIRELVDMLPALNVINDPKLNKLQREMKKKLCQFEPDQLRNNETARKDTAQHAKDILDSMAGYIGG